MAMAECMGGSCFFVRGGKFNDKNTNMTHVLGIVVGITKLGERVGEQVAKNTKLK